MSRYRVRRSLLFAPFLQHPGRLALSVLAIALGVALGYAVQLINQAAINEFAAAVQTLSGEADLAVRGPRAGFDESLYPRLAASSEVAVASPVLDVEAKLPGRREPLRVLGVDIFRAARVQPFFAAGGSGDRLDFLRPDRIFLSAAAAEWLGLKRDDALSIQVGLRVISLRVAGVIGEARRQRFAILDIGAAQATFGRSGFLNRIDLRLRPGVDPERFAARLQADLPAGTVVERPEADVERSGAPSRAYRVNLNVLALVALFTGGLLVFSAQALAVVRRRAQLALLRVLGMTRRALVAMLLAEAAVIGATGALAGIALGHASAALVLQRFGAELGGGYFRGLAPSLVLDWPALALFFSLGVLAALLGSLAPALEAARAEPAAALRAGDEERALRRLQPVWPGLAVLLAGAALTQAGPVRGLPFFGYGAIALLLIGTVMLMPRIAVLGFSVAPLFGPVAVRIGLAQLRGAPGQAGVSLAAIVASVSLMVSMAIMVASFRQSLDEWLERMLPADLYLRAGPGSDTAFLSPADQQAIATLPGVRRVEVLRSQRLIVAPDRPPLALLARVVEAEGRVPPLLGAAHPLKPGDPPAAWVSEVASDIYGWKPGAVIELPLGGRHARFTVAGIWRDYARQQGAVLIARRREFGVLRHIGMTRRQIGSMLAAQGLLVSALGLAVGLSLGWLISLVLIHVVNLQSFHWGMELHLPWQLLAEFVAVMLVLATFTAIASGRQAMSGEAVRAVKEDW